MSVVSSLLSTSAIADRLGPRVGNATKMISSAIPKSIRCTVPTPCAVSLCMREGHSNERQQRVRVEREYEVLQI